MKLIRTDRYVRQVVDYNGVILANILALTNGQWGLFDRNDKRLTVRNFTTAAHAFDFYKGMK